MPVKITAAFCGAGKIVGNNHLPALEKRKDRFEVSGFYDVSQENAAQKAGDKYRVYKSYEELLGDDSVQLVIIATKPLRTHYPLAKDALSAGKHVLLEKPMASTAAECDELIGIAKKKGKKLTVHHNRRLDLDFLALRDVMESGKIGSPVLIENRVVNSNYGGGSFVDWGIHLVDQSLILNNSPLREVSAVFCNPGGGADDSGYLDALFRFEEPPAVRMSMLPRTQEFLMNGTDALVRFYAAGTEAAFSQRVIECPKDMMNATQNFDNARPEYAVPGYLEIKQKEFYDFLYESLAEEAPLLVKPEEARDAMMCVHLMEKSARENRTVCAEGMLKS